MPASRNPQGTSVRCHAAQLFSTDSKSLWAERVVPTLDLLQRCERRPRYFVAENVCRCKEKFCPEATFAILEWAFGKFQGEGFLKAIPGQG